MTSEFSHHAVLLHEAVDAVLAHAVAPGRHTYIDATYGRGGHARLLLSRIGTQDRLVALDQDPQAVEDARSIDDPRFEIRHVSFASLGDWPAASVTGLLMDLGVSSPQIDDPTRGFSFRFDGPLDMRMDTTRGPSVREWLSTATETRIAEVIRDYGEERFARAIAKAIVARRQERGPVSTTAELAELVAGAVKTREPGQNPATRTFQALRIHVNAELEALQQALKASIDVLQPGGTLAVISFHSLEDRIVKQFMASHAHAPVDRRAPFAPPAPTRLEALRRIRPGAAEIAANPRARSAILRVARRSAA